MELHRDWHMLQGQLSSNFGFLCQSRESAVLARVTVAARQNMIIGMLRSNGIITGRFNHTAEEVSGSWAVRHALTQAGSLRLRPRLLQCL
jgi:hypothetical protein